MDFRFPFAPDTHLYGARLPCGAHEAAPSLQQLQVSRDLVHGALWRRADAEDCHAPRLDLGAAGVLDDLCDEAGGARLAAQVENLVLALDLQGNLGLAVLLPAGEDLAQGRVGGGAGECLKAGEGGVGALGGDFACAALTC